MVKLSPSSSLPQPPAPLPSSRRRTHGAGSLSFGPPRRVASLEALESRTLLTTMSISGTAGDDLISLSVGGGLVTAVVNGSPTAQSDLIVTAVTINALGGNDRIVIHSNGANPVTINAGAGDDIIEIAPASQNIDNIGAEITLNGEGGTDAAQLFDASSGVGLAYALTGGNQLTRGGAKVFNLLNLESTHVQAGNLNDTFSLQSPPALPISFDGNQGSDRVQVNPGGSGNITYAPHAAAAGAGTIALGAHALTFTSCADIFCLNATTLQVITPNPADTLTVAQLNATTNRLFGSSGAAGIVPIFWSSMSGKVFLELGVNDGPAAVTNAVTLLDGLVGSAQFGVEGGLQGNLSTNNLTINSGAWTIDTNAAAGRTSWHVTASGANTTVTFVTGEIMRRLELNNGATAQFSGINNDAFDLAIGSGTGTVSVAPAGRFEVFSNFSIAPGARLIKHGAGVMLVGPVAAQAHGAGSVLQVERGTFDMLSDAGSAAARTLTVAAKGSSVNFGATQHLAGVFADVAGQINLTANGNRVLVVSDAAVNGEGGQINLADNDMVVDYSGASPLGSVFNLIRNGFAGGGWNGIGITSSTAAANPARALGYAEATDLFTTFPATFSSEQIDDTAILVKHTFFGDANLDGNVNLADFNRLAANFGQSNRRWAHGDFDYNQTVNLADFNRLAATFGNSGLAPAGRSAEGWTVGSAQATEEQVDWHLEARA